MGHLGSERRVATVQAVVTARPFRAASIGALLIRVDLLIGGHLRVVGVFLICACLPGETGS